MDAYPKEFSSPARARIAAAKLRAQQAFRHDTSVAALTSNLLGEPLKERVTAYIMTVVLAFGREACALGRAVNFTHIGVTFPSLPWTVERIDAETRRFLDTFAFESFTEKGGGSYVHSETGKEIDGTLRSKMLNTTEWQIFEELCLEIAELQGAPAPDPHIAPPHIAPPPRPVPGGLTGSLPDLQAPSLIRNPFGPIRPIKSATASAIERFRREAGITQEELAERVGIHPSNVYRHESGDTTPQPWRISTYQRVLSELPEKPIVIPITPIKRK